MKNIRLATVEDEPTLRELWDMGDRALTEAPPVFHVGNFEHGVMGLVPHGRVLVAEKKGQVVGFAVVVTDGSLFMLDALMIAPEARGNGFGRELVEAAHRLAKDEGASAIMCLQWPHNGQDGFLDAMGYRVIGNLLEATL